jgi:CRISPR-associated protein Csd2
MSLQKKIDFAVVLRVENANPNGDPLNGNRPRTDYEGYGEITDVAIKRKIRDRLMEKGESIFVQSDDRKNDDATSLKNRADKALGKKLTENGAAELACKTWFDVRTFGQVLAFKGKKKGDGVSIAIRGPMSVHSAFSVDPVTITSTQITKSVSGEDTASGKKASDTMGMKHRVDHGIYVFYGSMNPQLAERTGFSDNDAETIKSILPKMLENDTSSARPDGSMEILKVIWWQHNCKSGQYSSAKVHKSLSVASDGSIKVAELDDLNAEIIDGF